MFESTKDATQNPIRHSEAEQSGLSKPFSTGKSWRKRKPACLSGHFFCVENNPVLQCNPICSLRHRRPHQIGSTCNDHCTQRSEAQPPILRGRFEWRERLVRMRCLRVSPKKSYTLGVHSDEGNRVTVQLQSKVGADLCILRCEHLTSNEKRHSRQTVLCAPRFRASRAVA